MRYFWLGLYYEFAKHLPKSTFGVIGKFARLLRYQCAKHLFAQCDGYVNVEKGAYFGDGKKFRVTGGTGIGKNFVSHDRIVTFHGGCLMGEDVMFLGDAHSFDDPSHPIGSGPKPMDVPLLICEDTWIGSRSIILSGCKRVGAHSIIGAGSVVTHDVPDYAIVGGNPAMVIRMRK